jgi:hypothetical protein
LFTDPVPVEFSGCRNSRQLGQGMPPQLLISGQRQLEVEPSNYKHKVAMWPTYACIDIQKQLIDLNIRAKS